VTWLILRRHPPGASAIDYHGAVKRAVPALVVLFVIAGCGDDGGAAIDSGVASTDAGADASSAPAAPMPPALARLQPCPAGWRELTHDDGFVVCEPWPVAGRGECEAGAAHYPGTPACVVLGPECPADGMPADLPMGRPVLFVRAGAPGGDGTVAAPYGTIAAATAVAVPGSVIALAVGEYEEEVSLGAGVALVGACVTGTVVTAATPRTDRGVINPDGADVEVRNLTIGPSPRPGLWIVGEGFSAVVTDLAIDGTQIVGISVERGAHLDADRLTVRNVENPSLMTLGRALNVEVGATATVRHLDARRNVEFGVAALTGGQLHLEDSVVAGTRAPGPGVNGGPGLAVFTGGHITAERVVVEDNQQVGILCFDEGSTAELSDTVVRRVEPWGDRGMGRALDVEDGALLSCRRCLLTEAHEISVGAGAATLVLEDVLIERVFPDAMGGLGAGMAVQTGATATLDRVAILDVEDFGIAVGESELTANDLVIRRVAPQRRGQVNGRALDFQDGATVTIRRFAASDLYEAGIVISGTGTDVVMEDVVFERVRSRPDGFRGDGFVVQDAASAVLSRVRVQDVHEAAVIVNGDATLFASDIVIREVAAQDCADSSCSAYPGGHGIGAYGARVVVNRFVIEEVDLCGLHVAAEGEFLLDDGVVRGAVIGACVQSDAQDIGDLGRSVDFVDNGTNLEATMLPVPDPLPSTD